ncbi:hypothetical protein A9Q84_13210 [Halobacteriovorax marinus]|uniref:Lipoprotein n=1 Tax=Halobacteriovorax marinus TaxID=97084 RepID=A0A1Y5FE82_9BACT|nr:hypothetical protein A9Q84_13210 [Halobacteriovorax marinus]
MKSKKNLLLLLFAVAATSCSTTKNYKEESAYQQALQNSFKEDHKFHSRELASAGTQLASIGFNIEKLRSFQVLSFPKITGIENKNLDSVFDLSSVKGMTLSEKTQYLDSLQSFGKPVTYEFHAVELQSCYKMIVNRPKHRPEKFFGSADLYKSNKTKKCLVLEVKKRPLTKRSRLRKDDLIALRLYFDDELRPFGKSVDYHDKNESKNTRTVDYRIDQRSSMSSELSEFPVDFPNFSATRVLRSWKKSSSATLNIPDQKYVQSKITKLVRVKKCNSGYQTNYKDIFGNKVRVGWCKGHSWPTTIHTNRFFSIVKRIK